jgi:hypothetical protein
MEAHRAGIEAITLTDDPRRRAAGAAGRDAGQLRQQPCATPRRFNCQTSPAGARHNSTNVKRAEPTLAEVPATTVKRLKRPIHLAQGGNK